MRHAAAADQRFWPPPPMTQDSLALIRALSSISRALQRGINVLLEAIGLDVLCHTAVVKFAAGMVLVGAYIAVAIGGQAAAARLGWI